MGKAPDAPEHIRVVTHDDQLKILIRQAQHHLTSPERATLERQRGLQVLSTGIGFLAFAVILYLVTRDQPANFAVVIGIFCTGAFGLPYTLFGALLLLGGLFPNATLGDAHANADETQDEDGTPLVAEVVLDVDGLSSWHTDGQNAIFQHGDFESVRVGPSRDEQDYDGSAIWVLTGSEVELLLEHLTEDEAHYIAHVLRSHIEG